MSPYFRGLDWALSNTVQREEMEVQFTSANFLLLTSSQCSLFLVLFLVFPRVAHVTSNKNLYFLLHQCDFLICKMKIITLLPFLPHPVLRQLQFYKVVNIYIMSYNHKQICSGGFPKFKMKRLCLWVI